MTGLGDRWWEWGGTVLSYLTLQDFYQSVEKGFTKRFNHGVLYAADQKLRTVTSLRSPFHYPVAAPPSSIEQNQPPLKATTVKFVWWRQRLELRGKIPHKPRHSPLERWIQELQYGHAGTLGIKIFNPKN